MDIHAYEYVPTYLQITLISVIRVIWRDISTGICSHPKVWNSMSTEHSFCRLIMHITHRNTAAPTMYCSRVFRFLCALNDTERGASIHLWWMSLITRHRYIDAPPAYALMSHQITHYWMVYDTRHKYSFMASSHHTRSVQHSDLLINK